MSASNRVKDFKKVFPVLLGNTLEFYDFCLYGLLAPTFANVFFPQHEQQSIALVFFIFAIAYVSRPVGAIFWGHIADKYGRKPVLLGTIFLMSIAAFGMAVVPDYDSIGLLACIIILVLRLFQGFAYGGEPPTVLVVCYEMAGKNNKNSFCSLSETFAVIGFLIGLLLVTITKSILSEEVMESYGWRFLFLFSLIFIFVIAYIRSKLVETKPDCGRSGFPLIYIFRHNYKSLFIMFSYGIGVTSLFVNYAFYNHILIDKSIQLSSMITLQICSISCVVISMPIFGYLCDKTNYLKLMRYIYLCLAILAIPTYKLLLSDHFFCVVLSYFIFGFFSAITIATYGAQLINQAPKAYRVSCLAISYGFAALFGALTPMFNEILIQLTECNISPSFYMVVCALVPFLSTYAMYDPPINKGV